MRKIKGSQQKNNRAQSGQNVDMSDLNSVKSKIIPNSALCLTVQIISWISNLVRYYICGSDGASQIQAFLIEFGEVYIFSMQE